ncbi:MAG: HAD-IA family hydrolase [Neisseriaceae bacterium]|nr:HAD-IA family hydrolase [Neisseriaceae bacterium]
MPLLVVDRDLPQTLNQIHGDKFIFSNAPHFYVDAIIEELQLEQFFKNIYACDDLGLKYKPEHTVYQNLLDDIGVSANDCIMIDDSVSNLQTAKDKGMKTVLIETSVQNIKQDFIDLSINSLQELADKQRLLF